ncbi:MAG: hypothetical protein KJ574_03450, partial [Nanoarchaeota archaeon]|nr:hypothetical protein [Nanoarchaeota archaeon]
DLSINILLNQSNPESNLKQLLPAMMELQQRYQWDYGVLKVKMELKKLGIEDKTELGQKNDIEKNK